MNIETQHPEYSTHLVPVPLSQEVDSEAYVSRRINTNMSLEQRINARRLLEGLDASGACLKCGRRVTSVTDAIRWLLENIGSGQTVTSEL